MSQKEINSFEELTFPSLLKSYDKILIPMIQRDYAQGRTDKKALEVRTNILNDIFDGKKEYVHFDLIFGSFEKRKENDGEKQCFIPVDGQQRLTTLFLLHIYAQKVKGLWSDLDLSRFSYDTRRAAADFCKKLATEQWTVSNGNISDAIKDTTWFMNYWEKDPTVEGMLNMLDAIHEKAQKEEFPCLDKVKFYFFDLESNGLNENLYLKMNSRGKPLTAFENLKASIEKVLPDNLESNDVQKYFPENAAAPQKSFKDKWKFFMDRDWTNAFWDKEHPENTDSNITAFIVRFLSGYWNAFSGEDIDITKDINSNEYYANFIPFEPIKTVLTIEQHVIQRLAYALTVISDSTKIVPYWNTQNDDYSNLSSEERCEYKNIAAVFAYVLFDGDKHAMRFAWNMAENTITGYNNFISYCKRIGEIFYYFKESNDDIYQILSTRVFRNPSAQLTEEISKAKHILWEEPQIDGKSWEKIIIEAEKHAFFKGAIRFLFTKENIGDDWNNFDTKWKNAQKYFDDNGVKDKTPYKSDALLMKSLLANSDDFGKNIWWHFEFSNDAIRWKRILIADHWRNAVDAIMCKEVTTETTKISSESIREQEPFVFIKNIVDDGLMDYVCNKMSGAWIRNTYHGYHAIWQSGYPSNQIVLNPILAQLKFNNTIDYSEKNKIENCRYYKCENRNADFKYNDHFFQWWGNPNEKELDVYLMEENWEIYKKRPNYKEGLPDKDNYYCFSVKKEMESDTTKFTSELDSLIEEASNVK